MVIFLDKCWLNVIAYTYAGVDIFSHVPINIVETNKHFGKRWNGIRKYNIYEQLDENFKVKRGKFPLQKIIKKILLSVIYFNYFR